MRPITGIVGSLMLGLLPFAQAADNHQMRLGSVSIHRLESRFHDDQQSLGWEAQAWYGTDQHQLVLKLEGERDAGGPVQHNESQLLYRQLLSDFWDIQAGLRHDDQPGPSRAYTVLGVSGLAPYWFEVDANLFFSERGDPSLRLETEYDLRLTQRLILQPSLEYNLALADDRDLGIGAGGSELELGLRLHYEVRREFAPYLGYVWSKTYGRSGDMARDADEHDEEGYWVAGVRLWF